MIDAADTNNNMSSHPLISKYQKLSLTQNEFLGSSNKDVADWFTYLYNTFSLFSLSLRIQLHCLLVEEERQYQTETLLNAKWGK